VKDTCTQVIIAEIHIFVGHLSVDLNMYTKLLPVRTNLSMQPILLISHVYGKNTYYSE